MDRQEEMTPEHPNNSNIRCSPQDKRCIQKTLARHPPKSTNLRSNNAREDAKAILVREMILGHFLRFTEKKQETQTMSAAAKCMTPAGVLHYGFTVPESQACNRQVIN